MADIRIKDLPTTASLTSSDDFIAIDGTTNGTRKLSAATPAFLTSVTTPSLTSPAATNLTLGLGTGGTALTLTNSTLAAAFAGVITTTSASGTVVSIPSGADNNRVIAIRNSGDTFSAFIGMSAAGNYVGSGANGDVMIRNDGGNIGFSANNAGVYYNGLFSPAGLAVTGTVSISSTTAASANAGALVIQGGISAGNTGSAASYFGGAVTVSGSALVQSGIADPFIHIKVTTDNAYNPYLHLEGYNRSFYVGVRDTGVDGLFSIASTSNLLSPLFSISAASPFTATFAGAVSITGNIGFYGQAATAKPTGVAVTAAAIHAALVTLNLISA